MRFFPRSGPNRALWLYLSATIGAAIAGCGGSSIERATVSGAVTLDGKPLPSGQVRFIPTGETKGPVWSAWIKDGLYTTEGSKGAPVGDLRVEISGFRVPAWYKPPAGASSEPGDENIPPNEQYLPAKYNSESDLKMTIPSGSGKIEKNWDLSSK